MINGIMKAIRHFEAIRKEQAQQQSDSNPFTQASTLTVGGRSFWGSSRYQEDKDRSVAPLQGRLNTHPEGGCTCTSICNECVDYQMTLNQAH